MSRRLQGHTPHEFIDLYRILDVNRVGLGGKRKDFSKFTDTPVQDLDKFIEFSGFLYLMAQHIFLISLYEFLE